MFDATTIVCWLGIFTGSWSEIDVVGIGNEEFVEIAFGNNQQRKKDIGPTS
jgi:hypothetical protein